MKYIKRLLKIILVLFLAIILLVTGYVTYLAVSYYRIEDFLSISVENNPSNDLLYEYSYSVMTYNIGFGAYSPDFSFFMDEGESLEGEKFVGKYAKARSEEEVIRNTNGAIEVANDKGADFYLFQEVDEKANRSYFINQVDQITSQFNQYGNSYAYNMHTGYLFYPFHDPHGAVQSGLLSLSKYKVQSSLRRSLPITDAFIDKFFDLDRCLLMQRFSLPDNKEFVLINIHLSAYDEGGEFRGKQFALLNDILEEEKAKGNYVVVGGDYNHELVETDFPTTQKYPEWVAHLDESDIETGYRIVKATNAPTCRSAEIPYQQGVNFTIVIDGFIVSDNIMVEEYEVIDTMFQYSDHNPVWMKFRFKNT